MKTLVQLLDDPRFTTEVPFKVENYSAGDVIVEEDEEGRDVFLILEGEAHVKTNLGGTVDCDQSAGLAKLKEADVFGEIAMFDGEPRTACVTAHTNCLVVRYDGPKLLAFMDKNPEIGYYILKDMFQHLVGHLRQNNLRAKTALQLYLTELSY